MHIYLNHFAEVLYLEALCVMPLHYLASNVLLLVDTKVYSFYQEFSGARDVN